MASDPTEDNSNKNITNNQDSTTKTQIKRIIQMPQIGWFEILIIVSVVIIVVGPKDFPVMIKKVGSWIGSIKRYVNSVQNQVTEITDIENDKNETINNNQNAISRKT